MANYKFVHPLVTIWRTKVALQSDMSRNPTSYTEINQISNNTDGDAVLAERLQTAEIDDRLNTVGRNADIDSR